MYKLRRCISVTKRPLAILFNLTITSCEKYGQEKVTKCPGCSTSQRGKNLSAKPKLKIETNENANPNVK